MTKTRNKPPPKPFPELFISKEGMATLWFYLAAGAVLASAVYAERATANKGLQPQVIVMGGEDSLVYPIVKQSPFAAEYEAELHDSQTRLLMDTIFNKSPSGLDAPDRCRRLVSKDVWNWIQFHLLEPENDAFKKGGVHQKVSIQSLTITPEDSGIGGSTSVEVVAQLIRTGTVDREIFNQLWKLSATVVWSYNPSLKDCGRHPLLCTSLSAVQEPLSTTQRKLSNEEELSIKARAAEAAEADKASAEGGKQP
jgi:hypothetical protein